MTRHDETQLWDYAARSLEAGESKLLEHHLEECSVCSEKLEAVVLARQALLLARQSKPLLAWAKVDSAVDQVIDRRLRAKTGRRPQWLVFGLLGAAVAAVLTFMITHDPVVIAAPPVEAVAVVAPLTESHVEHAGGLQVAGAHVSDGAALQSGDVLRTPGSDGKALIHLADSSHLRVANGTRVELLKVSGDDVSLSLSQGRIAVQASHQPRKDFVVLSGDVAVHVIGTVFSVSHLGAVTEVAVAEGRVRVETAGGDSVMIDPGQRVRFAGRNVQRGAVTAALQRELTEVKGVSEGEAAFKPMGSRPVTAPAMGGLLPRLDSREAKARQVVATAPAFPPAEKSAPAAATLPATGNTQVIEPLTEVLVEGPPQPPQVAPKPAPAEEWASLPAAKPAPAAKPIAKDLETIFLQKAEAAIAKGTCENFLLGLEEVASDAQTNERTELARILKARCFDIGLRPRQAMVEYRKYLETYPAGRFAAEAREAMGQ